MIVKLLTLFTSLLHTGPNAEVLPVSQGPREVSLLRHEQEVYQ